LRQALWSCLGGHRRDSARLDSTRQQQQQLFSFKTKIQRQIREEKGVIFHRGQSQGKSSKSATREQTQSAKFEVLKNRTKLARNPGFFAVLTREINWVFFDQNQR